MLLMMVMGRVWGWVSGLTLVGNGVVSTGVTKTPKIKQSAFCLIMQRVSLTTLLPSPSLLSLLLSLPLMPTVGSSGSHGLFKIVMSIWLSDDWYVRSIGKTASKLYIILWFCQVTVICCKRILI